MPLRYPPARLVHYNHINSRVGTSQGAGALDTRPGILGLYVDGVSPIYVTGKLKGWADHAGVSPVRIPSYWVHGPRSNLIMGEKPIQGSSDEKVLLYLHGGGYVAFSAHPDSPTGIIPRSIVQQCAGINVKRALCVEYRLSSYDPNPRENPFPTALLDALAGYVYLVDDVGFSPKNIIVVGDSAGGNLAIALVRYLIEHRHESGGEALAPPGAMILLSPWSDIGGSNSEDLKNTMHTNARSDYLEKPVMLPNGRARHEYHHYAFAGPHGVDFLDSKVYVSPASLRLKDEDVSFRDFPATFVDCGGGELFVDQIGTLVRRMKRDMGDRVVYHEAEDAVHDYMWVDWQEGHRKETLRVIEQWVAKL